MDFEKRHRTVRDLCAIAREWDKTIKRGIFTGAGDILDSSCRDVGVRSRKAAEGAASEAVLDMIEKVVPVFAKEHHAAGGGKKTLDEWERFVMWLIDPVDNYDARKFAHQSSADGETCLAEWRDLIRQDIVAREMARQAAEKAS